MKTWVIGAREAENSSSYEERFDAVSAGSVGEVGNGNMPKNDGISRDRNPRRGYWSLAKSQTNEG